LRTDGEHSKEAPYANSNNPGACVRVRWRQHRNRSGTVDVEQLDESAWQRVVGDALSRPRHAAAEAEECSGSIRYGQQLDFWLRRGVAIGLGVRLVWERERLGKFRLVERGFATLSVTDA